jgi:hypothetical protein
MEQIKLVSSQPIQKPPAKAPVEVPPPQKPSAADASAPQFVSPKGKIDAASGVLVVEIRNTSTGEVAFQYPSKRAASVYAAADKASEGKPAAPQPKPEATVSSDGDSKADVPSDKPVVAATLAGSE